MLMITENYRDLMIAFYWKFYDVYIRIENFIANANVKKYANIRECEHSLHHYTYVALVHSKALVASDVAWHIFIIFN